MRNKDMMKPRKLAK